MYPQSHKTCINIKDTTILLYGLKTRPLSLVPWRYQNTLFTEVTRDSLLLWVNREHQKTSKEISGLLFDSIYNITPMIYSYELDQYLLGSGLFPSFPIGASIFVSVGNPLQFSIPLSLNNLRINLV